MSRWLWASLLAGGVAGLAYWRRTLTADGALAASVVGAITFARGGMPGAAALLAFFASSSGLSRVAEGRKHDLPLAQSKGARRDAWQVLANGGIATLCAAAGLRDGTLGALSAAAADTWATELGLLARQPPRMLTTFRRVPAGTSGGVTPEGLLASLGGALTVGLSQACCGDGFGLLAKTLRAGLCGSVFDSLLGATLQATYFCSQCQVPTEHAIHQLCGCHTRLRHGIRWMTNDTVNALATLAGAVIALR